MIATETEPCHYCGCVADSRDHVVPQHLRDRIPEWRNITLPACRDCNSRLGGFFSRNMNERVRFVKEAIRRHWSRILRMPDWSEEELARLGPKLRKEIQAAIDQRDVARARLAWKPEAVSSRYSAAMSRAHAIWNVKKETAA